MAMTATVADAQPMSELNTTPLIDVMLVLLIMFILSIPAAYHSLEITLPPPPRENEVIPPVRTENVVGVDTNGAMSWNGMPVSESVLVAALGNATMLKPEPLVKFQPDAAAPYGASARAMSLVKASGVTAFAFVGNEQFADFAKAEPTR